MYHPSKAKSRCVALLIILVIFSLLSPVNIFAEEFTVSGFTEPCRDSILGISVTGKAAKIHIKEGERVRKGQIILELTQHAESLEVMRRQLLADNKTEVVAVSKQLKILAAHLIATKELYKSTGSIPREELENQQLEHDLAEVELLRLQQVEKREEIELDIAKEQQDKRTLRAPFGGDIAEIMIGLGENCELDTKLVRLVDTTQGYFVANVELNVTQRIKIGQEVKLQLQTGIETIYVDSQISFISPVVDPASGLRKIKAKFDNHDGIVIPGIAGVMIVNSIDQ